MKVPERIIGFLDKDEKQYPFEFDKDTFQLKLFFTSKKEARQHFFDGFAKMGSFDCKEHVWVGRSEFKGTTAEGLPIIFGVNDDSSSYQGYPIYNVNWYFITNEETERFDIIRITGKEVDLFFPPSQTFTSHIEWDQETGIATELSVSAESLSHYDCGNYIYNNKTVKLSLSAFPSMSTESDTPFHASSCLDMEFEEGIESENLLENIYNAIRLLRFATYRNNCQINTIEVLKRDSKHHITVCGIFVLNRTHIEENNKNVKKRIIDAKLLENHSADILYLIEENILPFEHYCESIDEMSHYEVSRIIMIFAGFEREFRNIYKMEDRRDAEFIRAKEETIEKLDNMVKENTGKRKKYFKEFQKFISNLDNSYGENLKYAFNNCKEIMEPFVLLRFPGQYEDIIEEVSSNINNLRNGIAHSRLDMEFEPRHLTDIKLVEEMIYAIRLKSINMETSKIQEAINRLFNENVRL